MIFLTLSLNAAVVGRVGAGAVDDRVGDAAEVLLELEEGDSAPVRGREDGVNTQTQVQVSADCLYVSPEKIFDWKLFHEAADIVVCVWLWTELVVVVKVVTQYGAG